MFATGFDALTGSVAIDIEGPDHDDGRALGQGADTLLGLSVAGFPNLFNLQGPGSPGVFVTMVTGIEHQTDWIVDCLRWMRDRGVTRCEAERPRRSGSRRWRRPDLLRSTVDSWYTGANVAGKHRRFMPYIGGSRPTDACAEVADDGYRGRLRRRR